MTVVHSDPNIVRSLPFSRSELIRITHYFAYLIPVRSRRANRSTLPAWRPVLVKDLPHRTDFSFDATKDALAVFARGEPIVVMDDEPRENEGDVIMSTSKCTTEAMAWIIKHTRSASWVSYSLV